MVNLNDRYMRNGNLPRAGATKNMSTDQLLEIEKCIDDPIYFAKTYFKIVHVDKGLIPFTLYEYQEEAIEKFQNTRNMIMCASRQCGKTSVATVILLHAALFNPTKLIAILANKAATAREILKRVKTAYEYLPDFLKGGVREWNKGSVEFENGSIIMAEASSSDNIRGKTVFLLYIDEMAFVENWEDFSASVLPTLSSGETTKIIFTSTPHGLNHFYYYVEGAKKKINDFELIEVPWQRVPGRDEKWKQKALKELNNNQLKFDQEYELLFIGSSGTLILGSALQLMMPEQPMNYKDTSLFQYKERVPGNIYVMSVDTSRGKGLDFSAFQIIDVTKLPYEVVCSYRNNLVTPSDFAEICNRFAAYYNQAQILVEINDLGQQVADILWEYEAQVICTSNNGRNGKQVSFSGECDRGVRTTTSVKAVGCMMLKLLVEGNKLIIPDASTITELNTFSAKGKSWEAEPGKHDDMVMCLVLFSWLCHVGYVDQLNNIDILKLLRERSDEDVDSDLLPFGILSDGLDEDDEPGWATVRSFDDWYY